MLVDAPFEFLLTLVIPHYNYSTLSVWKSSHIFESIATIPNIFKTEKLKKEFLILNRTFYFLYVTETDLIH